MDKVKRRTDNTARIRISLTLTGPYVDALHQLVDNGLYMEKQVAIRAALRLLFQHHKIEPFCSGLVEEVSEKPI